MLFFSAVSFATEVTIDSPDPTPIQNNVIEQPDVSYQKLFFKTIFLISGGFATVFALIWFLRKFSNVRLENFNQSSHIKIIERRPLSQKSMLYLIQVGNQKIVITESQLEVKKIADIQSQGLE